MTSLPAKGQDDTLYLLDLSSYVFRAYHALPPLSSSRGEPTHAVHGVTAMLQKLVKEQDPAFFAVAIDAPGPSFRKKIFEGYKANRPPTPPDLKSQMQRVLQIVEAWEIPTIGLEGYEADDVIATIVAKARAQGLKVVVVSADKDLLQLVEEGVLMYDSMRERVFGSSETEGKMLVPPSKVRDLLALTGDTSDNVPGVPSVGPKTAAKLLDRFGDLDGIYEHLDEVKGKLKERLEAHRADAFLSRDLVSLHDDLPLDFSAESCRMGPGDNDRLRALFLELELTNAMRQLEPVSRAPTAVQTILDADSLEAFLKALRDDGEMAIRLCLDVDDSHRGRLVGFALAGKNAGSAYIPLGHRRIDAPAQIHEGVAMPMLRALIEDGSIRKVGADLKSVHVALARHGIELRGADFDITIASYLLEPGRHGHAPYDVLRAELGVELPAQKKGTQEGADLEEVSVVAERLGREASLFLQASGLLRPRMEHGDFRRLMYELEMPLADVLARLELIGIRLDLDLLAELAASAGEELEALEARAHALAGESFNLGSPRQLETILFDRLGLPVIKKTKTARSTDHQVLEELAGLHELPAVILEHRSIAKLKGTYLDALPVQVSEETGRIHTRFNQVTTATGRLSSSDPNLQNIPIRTALGRRIREAFIPDDDWLLCAADYSQIELRLLAHFSQDEALVEAYTTGEDVHTRTAMALFDVAADEVSKEQRARAKTVNFAVLYGQTQFALARNLRIDRGEAQRYIDAFFERYAGVERYMQEVVEEARASGYVTTLLGRRRALPDLRSSNHNLRSAAERMARNTPLQGTAADIMKQAMVTIDAQMRSASLNAKMLLTVHDELVFEVPPGEREAMEKLVVEGMEGAAELSVPLTVEVGWGTTWGAAH